MAKRQRLFFKKGEYRMAIYTAWEMERINSEHEPKLDLKIARYISCNKLESMLSSNTLFFCNAFNFEDK